MTEIANSLQVIERMAGTTGLEPAASAVTGQRSNQLNYVPTRQINEMRNRQCYAAMRSLRGNSTELQACASCRNLWLNDRTKQFRHFSKLGNGLLR